MDEESGEDDDEVGEDQANPMWAGVWAVVEEEFRIPKGLPGVADSRTRTTRHCQRLLREHWISLAVPARATPRAGSDDPKGNFVVAFTDDGPWLFKPGRGNPALPIKPIGPIADPTPISFGPHKREGGVLSFGGVEFLIPIAYANSVRALIEALAD